MVAEDKVWNLRQPITGLGRGIGRYANLSYYFSNYLSIYRLYGY